jgi:RNA polymerase sigma factor (sigma-70 family)
MAWSLPVLTAVLLGLGAQPGDARPLECSLAWVTSASSNAGCTGVADAAEPAASPLSGQTVSRAGLYLRSRAMGQNPDAPAAAAWGRFFPACDRLIRQYAGHFSARGVDVEDCVQETWSQLLRTLPTFQLEQGRGHFGSWLYAVVRSKAHDILRRAGRQAAEDLSPQVQASFASRDADPADEAERSSAIEQVRSALAELRSRVSDPSYRVLHLRHLEGRSVSEVADALGMTPQQVWARDHRMRCKLRDLLIARSADFAPDATIARDAGDLPRAAPIPA